MSSDFDFNVTSCFLGNVLVKLYLNIQCPPPLRIFRLFYGPAEGPFATTVQRIDPIYDRSIIQTQRIVLLRRRRWFGFTIHTHGRRNHDSWCKKNLYPLKKKYKSIVWTSLFYILIPVVDMIMLNPMTKLYCHFIKFWWNIKIICRYKINSW